MTETTDSYMDQGYAVVRGLFSPDEIQPLKAATDRLKQRILEAGGINRGNVWAPVEEDANIGPNVRVCGFCALLEPELEPLRRDPRMYEVLKPLLSDHIRQVINQLHWKTPGSRMVIQFHTDRQNREANQRDEIRHIERSFIQTAVAIDPMTEENGALLVVPGSHRRPDQLGKVEGISSQDDLREGSGFESVPIYAEPGDFVMWHPDTIHGSALNRHPSMDRCIYINGYVDAHHCTRGYWAWIKGQPVPLADIDVPVVVSGEPTWNKTRGE